MQRREYLCKHHIAYGNPVESDVFLPMKIRLRIDTKWLRLEQKSMDRIRKTYESWESETLRKAQDAKDLSTLREVFYQLGDRWEWDQATGAWLSGGEPLDAVGLILSMPGLEEGKERYVIYTVMAYSKGLTQKFDHLGDKERIIVEIDKNSGEMYCWSTTGHGAMDLFPTSLNAFDDFQDVLESCDLVAQPGDHALRIDIPKGKRNFPYIIEILWEIAVGKRDFVQKEIDLLTNSDIEDYLGFRFHRYAKAVIRLEQTWRELNLDIVDSARESIIDDIPSEVEKQNKLSLRIVEGLLHILWFKPPTSQIKSVRKVYETLASVDKPTNVEQSLIQCLGELSVALTDVLERAQYLKWKSVIDKKAYSESDVFQDLSVSELGKQALAVALDDILREHTLSYIGYPERARIKDKLMRISFGVLVLPIRLLSSFWERIKTRFLSDEQKDAHETKPDFPKEPHSTRDSAS
ncbi:MAG: hypothetical protein BAJATHORv1_40129 [Candidatus Thorarchaeota archaeon]|nr:MAG: hypothetical protein BAJATHORv1_40129 [Candidatus Thorarchaeota archaeon]